MKAFLAILLAALLAGCAGSGLKPGQSDQDEVVRVMGEPAMKWADADGSRLLAFPRGPMGVHSYMVRIGPDGKVQSIENALATETFARIQAGMGKEQVLRTLGPPDPAGTVYFKARDELVWEWRYCDDWSKLARFEVLFDGTTGLVRSTMSLREEQVGRCGGGEDGGGCWCGR